jgi:hypothetical protein
MMWGMSSERVFDPKHSTPAGVVLILGLPMFIETNDDLPPGEFVLVSPSGDMVSSTCHECPPRGSSLTPCCGRSPFEIPAYDRLTVDPAYITCTGR